MLLCKKIASAPGGHKKYNLIKLGLGAKQNRSEHSLFINVESGGPEIWAASTWKLMSTPFVQLGFLLLIQVKEFELYWGSVIFFYDLVTRYHNF